MTLRIRTEKQSKSHAYKDLQFSKSLPDWRRPGAIVWPLAYANQANFLKAAI